MSTLQNLVTACQADDAQLREQAQARTDNWQPWLAPLSVASPTGEDPDMTMIFSVSAKRLISSQGLIPN